MSALQRLKEKREAERRAKSSHAKRPESERIGPEDIELRGTGLTARALERGEKQYEKQVAASMGKGAERAATEAREHFQDAVDETIAMLEAENQVKNIELDPSQAFALNGMISQRVSILVGAAGTGKTTVTRKFLAILKERFERKHPDAEGLPPFCCAAYTGRATQQTRRALPEEWRSLVFTIHKLLGYEPTTEIVEDYDIITKQRYNRERMVFRPSFGLENKLPYMLYIFDEASMIPVPLFNEAIDAMPKGARIVLIGDLNQLPPVYAKSVLGYALRKWPTFELTKIHRQSEGNSIIMNSQRVLRGQMLQKAENFFLIGGDLPAIQGQAGMQTFTRQIMSRLKDQGKFDPYRDTVITATNEGMLGRHELNDYFQTMFNPEKKEGGIILNKRIKIHTGRGQVIYAVGDKVIIEQNINTVSPPITNGSTGVVESINLNGRYDHSRAQTDFRDGPVEISESEIGNLDDFMKEVAVDMAEKAADTSEEDESVDQRQSSHVMTIRFENGQTYAASTAGDYRKINFGYAVTCHKAQGGEYPNVVIILHSCFPPSLVTQEWLYTAITRARQNVYLIYNTKGLQRSLKNQRIKGKTLQDKIKNYVSETKSNDVELVGNPWNVDRTKFPILFNPESVE